MRLITQWRKRKISEKLKDLEEAKWVGMKEEKWVGMKEEKWRG